jgi:hypothetical protein
MKTVPDVSDVLLLNLDPSRGLRRILSDLDRFAKLDPKIDEARRLLGERFDGFSENDLETTLGPALWLTLNGCCGWCLPLIFPAIRSTLRDGDVVLRAVEDSLATVFAPDVLQQVNQEAELQSRSDSDRAEHLRRARDELRRIGGDLPQDGPALAPKFALGLVVGLAVGIVVGMEIATSQGAQ